MAKLELLLGSQEIHSVRDQGKKNTLHREQFRCQEEILESIGIDTNFTDIMGIGIDTNFTDIMSIGSDDTDDTDDTDIMSNGSDDADVTDIMGIDWMEFYGEEQTMKTILGREQFRLKEEMLKKSIGSDDTDDTDIMSNGSDDADVTDIMISFTVKKEPIWKGNVLTTVIVMASKMLIRKNRFGKKPKAVKRNRYGQKPKAKKKNRFGKKPKAVKSQPRHNKTGGKAFKVWYAGSLDGFDLFHFLAKRKELPKTDTKKSPKQLWMRFRQAESPGESKTLISQPLYDKRPETENFINSNTKPVEHYTSAEKHNAIIPDNDRLLCKVCYMNELSILFLPCSHMVACRRCAARLKTCPVCRSCIKEALPANLHE